MKTTRFLFVISLLFIFISCNKPGYIKVQNNITKVTITDVKWGKNYIAYELLPGQTTDKITITSYDEKLPASHKISFIMTANNKSIYLETEEEYFLDEEDLLQVILTDETKVKNPNE